MTKQDLITQIERIIQTTSTNPRGGLTQAREFVRVYISQDSHFYKSLNGINIALNLDSVRNDTTRVLLSLKDYIENDLLKNISLIREIQLETVSDYLEMSQNLINDKNVHSAAAIVIIGASLEEFLRNWLEESEFDLTSIKNSIDAYMKALKILEKINKQDIKDITSWAGIRNDAAHGHWENVEDKNRAKLMLEGVNLFIRKYSV